MTSPFVLGDYLWHTRTAYKVNVSGAHCEELGPFLDIVFRLFFAVEEHSECNKNNNKRSPDFEFEVDNKHDEGDVLHFVCVCV